MRIFTCRIIKLTSSIVASFVLADPDGQWRNTGSDGYDRVDAEGPDWSVPVDRRGRYGRVLESGWHQANGSGANGAM